LEDNYRAQKLRHRRRTGDGIASEIANRIANKIVVRVATKIASKVANKVVNRIVSRNVFTMLKCPVTLFSASSPLADSLQDHQHGFQRE
jgi:hypothetical protein